MERGKLRRQGTGLARPGALVPKKRATLPPLASIDANLLGRIERNARDPDVKNKPALVWIDDVKGGEHDVVTHAELWTMVSQAADLLINKVKLEKGDRAVLIYDSIVDFAPAFLGCLLAGVIAVPFTPLRTTNDVRLLAELTSLCKPRAIFASRSVAKVIKAAKDSGELSDLLHSLHLKDRSAFKSDLAHDPDQVAYLQYTPRATSTPRAVEISMGNLSHNLAVLDGVLQLKTHEALVGFLPTSHNMNIVPFFLNGLCCGCTQYHLRSTAVLHRPALWLEMAAEHEAAVIMAPPEAYDLAASKWPADHGVINLSNVRLAVIGPAPVLPATLAAFSSTFAPHAFDSKAFDPTYGLAEHAFYVCDHRVMQSLDAPSPSSDPSRLGCGFPPYGIVLKIVDPETSSEVPEGATGEIWLDSPSKAVGYWGDKAATDAILKARLRGDRTRRYLRTGDLGLYDNNGQVIVLGRLQEKTLAGSKQPRFPEDVESAVHAKATQLRVLNSIISFRPPPHEEALIRSADRTCCLLFDDGLVLLGELASARDLGTFELRDAQSLASTVAILVQDSVGVAIHRVVLAEALPVTDAGQVDRARCRRDFVAGDLRILFDLQPTVAKQKKVTLTDAPIQDTRGQETLLKRKDAIAPVVARCLAEALGPNPPSLSDTSEMSTFMVSIVAARLKTSLQEQLKLNVPPELFFEAKTIGDLVSALAALEPASASALPAARAVEPSRDGKPAAAAPACAIAPRPDGPAPVSGTSLSLMFFSSDDDPAATEEKYKLYLEASKYADESGFEAVWTPERHFHRFGGVFPNATQTSIAIAQATTRVRVRAGSIVIPLHDTLRVAEEAAAVDCLSGGRFDTALATGWNLVDFVLAPETYTSRREVTYDAAARLRRLWEGQPERRTTAAGTDEDVQSFPRPVQQKLALWLTSIGNERTIIDAGALGLHLLTALLFQTAEQLEARIKLYRQALAVHGFDQSSGRVTLMLHTFVGPTMEAVHAAVKGPFCNYLRSSISLWRDTLSDVNAATASREDEDKLIEQAYYRYVKSAALIGTPESVTPFLQRLFAAGVDEVACLIDFGMPTAQTLASLPLLASVMHKVTPRRPGARSPQYLIRRSAPAPDPSIGVPPPDFQLGCGHALFPCTALRKRTAVSPGRPMLAEVELSAEGDAPIERRLTWLPGQYLCIFLASGPSGAPTKTSGFFSIASVHKGKLRLIVAESRDSVSRAFMTAEKGLRVFVDASAHGYMFFPRGRPSKRCLLVGAGTAISPLLAIYRHCHASEVDAVLLASVKSPAEVKLYEALLDKTASSKVSFHVTQPVPAGESWSGPVGRVGAEALSKAMGGMAPADLTVYVSGPGIFVVNMLEILRRLKVPDANILTESSVFTTPVLQQSLARTFARPAAASEPAPAAAKVVEERRAAVVPAAAPAVPPAAPDPEPIAIVGVAGRFPGSKGWVEMFEALLAGKCSITSGVAPDDPRLEVYDRPLRAAGVPAGGAFLRDIDRFDAAFFRTREEEACVVDPQQRLLLELAWEALCDAGYTEENRKSLEGARVGVFVGATGVDYRHLLSGDAKNASSPYLIPGIMAVGMLAARIAYWLGSTGPAHVVDTSCTSALTAIAAAAASLRSGSSSIALVGAANLLIDPTVTLGLFKQGLLNAEDPPQCRPFDETTHGYVRADGLGMLVMKRLSHAVRDGDYVHAVIRGVSAVQAGRRLALSLPTTQSQVSAIQEALAEAKLRPSDIHILEAQAIGTSVGDSYELKALATAYADPEVGPRRAALVIGASKANLGHSEAASGLAGLCKLILVMARRVVPPNINWRSLPANSANVLSAVPAAFPSAPMDLPPAAKLPLINCALHSYGQTGSVGHLVLQSYPNSRPYRPRPPVWNHEARYWLSGAPAVPLLQELPLMANPVEPSPAAKKRLPPEPAVEAVVPVSAEKQAARAAPADDIELQVAAIFCEALGLEAVGVPRQANLFSDLGGSSLTAIAIAERVNERFGLSLDVGALLDMPSVALLAGLVARSTGHASKAEALPAPVTIAAAALPPVEPPTPAPEDEPYADETDDGPSQEPVEPSLLRGLVMALVQLPCILLLSLLVLFPVWPALKLCLYVERTHGLVPGLAFVGIGYILFGLGLCFEMVVAKWLIMWRYTPRTTAVNGLFYLRWWFVDRLFEFGTPLFVGHLRGTPLWNVWLTLLGARVDLYAHVDTTDIAEFDLVRIGSGCTIEQDAVLRPARFVGRPRSPLLVLSVLELADGTRVGPRAVVRPESDGAACSTRDLGPLSTKSRPLPVPSDARDPEAQSLLHPAQGEYGAQEVVLGALAGVVGLYLLAGLSAVAFYPAFRFVAWLLEKANMVQGLALWDDAYIIGAMAATQPYYIFPFLTVLAELEAFAGVQTIATTWYVVELIWVVPALYLSYGAAMALLCTAAKWLLLWRVKPATLPRGSAAFYARWFVGRLIVWTYPRILLWLNTWVSLAWLASLGVSLNPFNQIAIDAAPFLEPDLIHMGSQASVASSGAIYPASVTDDVVTYSRAQVPDGGAVGLHGVLLGGSRIPAGCLVGALTAATPETRVKPGAGVLLGKSSLPARPEMQRWWENRPPKLQLFKWVVFNVVYPVLIPATLLYLMGCFAYPSLWVMAKFRQLTGLASLALMPVGFALLAVCEAGLLILIKWLLVQRFRAEQVHHAETTFFHYRRTVVMHTRALCDLIFLPFLLGTPWYCWLQNAIGGKIASSAIVLTMRLYESDLIRVGPNSVVEREATLSPHMREGETLSLAAVSVGAGCTLRTHSVCLLGVQVQDGATLLPLALAVNSQVLLSGKRYRGVPSVSVSAAARPPAEASNKKGIDWVRESTLPADLQKLKPALLLQPEDQPPTRILLTGATGYFGPWLLAELLRSSPAVTVYCLVRGATNAEAHGRLVETCDRFHLKVDMRRVRVIVGTLEQEKLGVSPDDYSELLANVDSIVHNAAVANFVLPYDRLKPANVNGTLHILRLAAASVPVKPVHYISSCAVFAGGNERFTEDAPFTDSNFPHLAYSQSKRVAETLVRAARSHGVPAAVYRLSNLGPDSASGCCNTADFLVRLLCGCCQMGQAPTMPTEFNIVPVDFAASAVASFVMAGPPKDMSVMHITHPRGPTSLATLIQHCNSAGYPIAEVAYAEWQRSLSTITKANALYALKATFSSTNEIGLEPHDFACERTMAALSRLPGGSKVECAEVDSCMIQHALRYCVEQSLLDGRTALEASPAKPSGLARPLRPLEGHIRNLSINVVVRVGTTRPLTPEDLRTAYACAAAKHPYLRMRIAKEHGGGARFEEIARPEDVPLEHHVADVGPNTWLRRLQRALNAPDFTRQAVLRMELVMSKSSNTSEIYWTVCHAATDGRAVFLMMHDMLTYLGQILDGVKVDPATVPSRPFIDLVSALPLDRAASLAPPKFPPVGSVLPPPPVASSKIDRIHALFDSLTPAETKLLLARCKEHDTTLQAVLSAVTALGTAYLQRETHPLPQTAFCQLAVQLRNFADPPLPDGGKEDSVAGGTPVWWSSVMSQTDTAWTLSSKMKRDYEAELAKDGAMRFFAFLRKPTPQTPPTAFASNVGLNPTLAEYGKSLKVESYFSAPGNIGGKLSVPGTAVHGQTFGGSMHVIFTYTSPAYSREQASAWMSFIMLLLHRLANSDPALGALALPLVLQLDCTLLYRPLLFHLREETSSQPTSHLQTGYGWSLLNNILPSAYRVMPHPSSMQIFGPSSSTVILISFAFASAALCISSPKAPGKIKLKKNPRVGLRHAGSTTESGISPLPLLNGVAPTGISLFS